VIWEYLHDARDVADAAAWRIAAAGEANPRLVLGLATGPALVETCRRLVAASRGQGPRLDEATLFGLEELVGVPPDHAGSSRTFLQRHLVAPLGLEPARVEAPDGWLAGRVPRHEAGDAATEATLAASCARFEERIAEAGGLDLAVVLLGPQGQLAGNEPGTARTARTRVVELPAAALHASAPFFAGEREPRRAITAGIATLLAARTVVLLALGADRAEALARLRRGGVDEALPASALHLHPDVTVLVERRATDRRPRRP
jgi:glucosamine-6-phosphate deaminase